MTTCRKWYCICAVRWADISEVCFWHTEWHGALFMQKRKDKMSRSGQHSTGEQCTKSWRLADSWMIRRNGQRQSLYKYLGNVFEIFPPLLSRGHSMKHQSLVIDAKAMTQNHRLLTNSSTIGKWNLFLFIICIITGWGTLIIFDSENYCAIWNFNLSCKVSLKSDPLRNYTALCWWNVLSLLRF